MANLRLWWAPRVPQCGPTEEKFSKAWPGLASATVISWRNIYRPGIGNLDFFWAGGPRFLNLKNFKKKKKKKKGIGSFLLLLKVNLIIASCTRESSLSQGILAVSMTWLAFMSNCSLESNKTLVSGLVDNSNWSARPNSLTWPHGQFAWWSQARALVHGYLN